MMNSDRCDFMPDENFPWLRIRVQGFTFDYPTPQFDTWHFYKADRYRETGTGHDGEQIVTFIGYRVPVARLRRRLELAGIGRESLEAHFTKNLTDLIAYLQGLEAYLSAESEYEHEDQSQMERDRLMREADCNLCRKFLNAVSDTCLDDWLSRFKQALSYLLRHPDSTHIHRWNDLGDPLLSSMVSRLGTLIEEGSDFFNFHFPCSDPDLFMYALLSVCDDDSVCSTEITDLVGAGYLSDFSDLEELHTGTTLPCRSCMASLDELKVLSDGSTSNVVLQRMCYSSIITAMEAYLSDIMKRSVREPAIRRRFVETSKLFDGEKFKLSMMFKLLDGLEERIDVELNKLSFHNIRVAEDIFREVLLISFPEKERDILNRAVLLRHDIVHRNGKHTTGREVSVGYVEVSKLDSIVRSFISCIDNQILDSLRLPDNEDTQG